MRQLILFVLCCCLLNCGQSPSIDLEATTKPGSVNETTMRLPNNWLLTPIGEQINVGDLPLAIALHPEGRYAAVTNGGYLPDYVSIIDLKEREEVQQVRVPHCWVGVEFSPDGGQLAVSITSRNTIYLYDFTRNRAVLADSVVLGQQVISTKIYPAGLAYTPDARYLVVANILSNSITLIDVPGKRVLKDVPCDPYPNYVQIHPVGHKAYVSTRGGNSVQILSLPELTVLKTIPVGSRPNHMVLSFKGDRLFVACANSDDVYVIDTAVEDVIDRIDLRPYPQSRPGTTPNGVAVTGDGRTLYAVDADNNDVAIVDVSRHPACLLGRLPTGWYPTAVALANNDRTLLVANGKGLQSKANPQGPQPTKPTTPETEYIGRLFRGTLALVALDSIDDALIAKYTTMVAYNNGWDRSKAALERGNLSAKLSVIPRRVGEPSKIKYVLYIIKENRTYDQVFGDLPQGDGDSTLCLFPEEVTPNHHKLAKTWVLFDNFFVDSEVSMDGHPWSTAAIAVDYIEKTWPSRYSRQGLFYAPNPNGGADRHILAEEIANPDEGYIWDMARRAGLRIRSYWELPAVASLQGYLAPIGDIRDTLNIDYRKALYYIKELREYEKNGEFPQFQVMSLGNDHTRGTRPGQLTPQACVGDNDQALGMIIEALSQSRFWPEMAVFVVQDDAQNGPDHVDAHRTVALVASPYARRGYVDHTQYSTVSMLKTIELILGLPPMTQFDAAAVPMVNAFMEEPDLTPYGAEPPRIDLSVKNQPLAFGAEASMQMNLDDFDDLTIEEEQVLNEAIWKSVKGVNSQMPKPVYWATHWAFGRPEKQHN